MDILFPIVPSGIVDFRHLVAAGQLIKARRNKVGDGGAPVCLETQKDRQDCSCRFKMGHFYASKRQIANRVLLEN